MIGASYITKETLDEFGKTLPPQMTASLKIPGLLFIDTPGHEAFTRLRERGGSIADIAILVVDVQQGFQPQTIESLNILKQYKTPFVIAANKIDLIQGWKSQGTTSSFASLSKQQEHVKAKLEEKIYELVGKISEYGFNSERFDRVTDFKTQIAIIPCSGKTKEGISELLVLIAGLSQKFLGENLNIDEEGQGKGTIMEIKEEKGLGITADVIFYEGVVRKNDEIAYLTSNGVKQTRIRGLLEPNLSGKEKFKPVDQVVAAAGVKLYAPEMEDALPGSPLVVIKNFEEDKKEIEEQFKTILISNEGEGVIVKADSLGSVHAILNLLEKEKIPVHSAGVGKITKKDLLAAKNISAKEAKLGVVLGFNVTTLDEATQESNASKIPIITSNIIYSMLDQYKAWIDEQERAMKKEMEAKLPWPGKIKLLKGCCFRASNPCIFGAEVTGGRIKKGYRLMNLKGEIVAYVREMQHEKKPLDEATRGMQIAFSCDDAVYGKNIKEGDTLFVYMTPDERKIWEKKKSILAQEDVIILDEIVDKLRKSI